MKSTRAKAYINESLTIEGDGEFGISQQDAICAVEIAEYDMLSDQQEQNRKDLNFLQDMLKELDEGKLDSLRVYVIDWRDELEEKIARQKKMLSQ